MTTKAARQARQAEADFGLPAIGWSCKGSVHSEGKPELAEGAFDCGWSLLLNHGVAERKRLNLGNLNPIYERELTKLDVHQGEGWWNVSKDGAGRRGCRHK